MSNLQELHNDIETFEASATAASAALLSRFSELKKRCQENKIPIFALLKPHCRRVVITAFTSFSNAAAAVKRLGGPPWNASIDDLIGAFGEETLLSESFLRALDDLSQVEPPPSWHQTRHAITRASLERKASTENTRIPRLRLFTPKDVVAAKSFLHPGVTARKRRKKRGTLASRKRVRLSPVLDNDSCDDSSKDEELALTFERHYGDLEGDDVLDTVQDGGGFMGDFVSGGFISDDFESTSSESESDMENGLFIDYAQAASHSAEEEEGTQEDVEDEADGLSTPEPVAAAFGANDSLSPPRSPKTPPPSQLLLAHGFPFSSPVMELAIRSSGGRSAGRKYSAGLSNAAALKFDDDPPDSPTASIRAAASRLGGGIRQLDNAPHSSLDQVLNQLRDGGCVGHAAIWTLLELLARSPELRVIDVAYPTGSSWADWASLRRYKPHPGVKHILVPLHVPHARHWVLLHFDLASAHVTVFDSLLESRTSSRSDYFEAATAIVRYLGLDWDGGAWDFEVDDQHAPLQQDDDADNSCGGIFVVVTSVCIAAKEAMPPKINARIWRLIFRCALARDVSESDDLFSFGCGQALLHADLCGAVEHTRRRKAVLDDLDGNVGLAGALSTKLLASAASEVARLGVNVQKWQDAQRVTEQLLASLDALGSSADTKSAVQTALRRLTEEQSRVNAMHEREMAKEKRLRAFCEVVSELKVQCRVLQRTTGQEITRAVDMLRSLL